MLISAVRRRGGLSRQSKQIIISISMSLVILGLILIFGGFEADQPVLPGNQIEPAVIGETLNESDPVRLRIPALNIDTSFVELGLQNNNEIEIPSGFEEVGWYKYGPTPGELGPAVVLGHVDSYSGPAVFFYLGQLNPGDRVEIDRADGTTAIFRIDKLERYLQSEFPTSLVYGDLNHAGLRLITCSGSYDREQRRYESNLIVFASLVETR